jgi:ADP-ribose pyrophosphatase YjhB (NUDIX family)
VSHANKASGVALISGKLILLGKRVEEVNGTKVPFGGYWSIFGGALDEGESVAECAVRELLEETLIKVNPGDLKYVGSIINCLSFSSPNRMTRTEFFVHVCKIKSKPLPTLNNEHTESGWFEIGTLKSFPEKIDERVVRLLVDNI